MTTTGAPIRGTVVGLRGEVEDVICLHSASGRLIPLPLSDQGQGPVQFTLCLLN